ncbi:MAG: nucleoside monophosphate kinase [Patescibacteria group bacterium]
MNTLGNPKHLVFLGPPGSGKGTQAKLLMEQWKMNYLSTGDMVRDFLAKAKDGDNVGSEMKVRYDKGIPQPDDLIIKGVREVIKNWDLRKGVIFDSFPLSEQQAWGLDLIVKDFIMEIPIVLYIAISEEEAVNRLSKRKYCPNCKSVFYPLSPNYESGSCDKCSTVLISRSDDKPEVVKKRYLEYVGRMEALKKFYEPRLRWVNIDGEQSVEEVQQEIIKKLTEFRAKRA